MPEQSIIVWDLEMVPDLAAAGRMLGIETATDPEVREALGPGFPKHPLHKIAFIGALIASRELEIAATHANWNTCPNNCCKRLT
jgi:hypothetical protein